MTTIHFSKKQPFKEPTFKDNTQSFQYNGFTIKIDGGHWLIDAYGIFNECEELMCVAHFLRHDIKFDNHEVLSALNIEWSSSNHYGRGTLSSLVFFILSVTHRKIHLNEHMIREYGYLFKKLYTETSMIAKGYNSSKEFVSDDAMTILNHPAKLDVVVETLHSQEPHGRIEGFHYPVLFKDGSFD